jgi:hypothetical protein
MEETYIIRKEGINKTYRVIVHLGESSLLPFNKKNTKTGKKFVHI